MVLLESTPATRAASNRCLSGHGNDGAETQECDIFFNLLGSKTFLPVPMSKFTEFTDRRFDAVHRINLPKWKRNSHSRSTNQSFCQRQWQGKIDVCRRQCIMPNVPRMARTSSIQPFDETMLAMLRSFQMSCRTIATKGQCDTGKQKMGLVRLSRQCEWQSGANVITHNSACSAGPQCG